MNVNLEANSELRTKRFIETVLKTEEVWGLQSEAGWAICESTKYEDCQVMPFFSHESYAKAIAKEEWESYNPTIINLDDFIDKWLKGMHKDELLVGVNWLYERLFEPSSNDWSAIHFYMVPIKFT